MAFYLIVKRTHLRSRSEVRQERAGGATPRGERASERTTAQQSFCETERRMGRAEEEGTVTFLGWRGEERDDLGALSFSFFLQPCNGFASRSRASDWPPAGIPSRHHGHDSTMPSIPIIGKMEPRLTIVLLDTSVLIEALPQQISRRQFVGFAGPRRDEILFDVVGDAIEKGGADKTIRKFGAEGGGQDDR